MSFSLPPADALTLNFIAFFAPQHPKGGEREGALVSVSVSRLRHLWNLVVLCFE